MSDCHSRVRSISGIAWQSVRLTQLSMVMTSAHTHNNQLSCCECGGLATGNKAGRLAIGSAAEGDRGQLWSRGARRCRCRWVGARKSLTEQRKHAVSDCSEPRFDAIGSVVWTRRSSILASHKIREETLYSQLMANPCGHLTTAIRASNHAVCSLHGSTQQRFEPKGKQVERTVAARASE